ncbi:MAG: hypothetical protein LBQ62_01875 [Candidatus Accumulibacter sp.]|jgi:hypothetical protein|nr:hypothetical protein [Accumulibacter sp.]
MPDYLPEGRFSGGLFYTKLQSNHRDTPKMMAVQRAYGSHCGRDARAPIGSFARKTQERGRLARFVGLTFSRTGDKEPGPESLKFVANQVMI